MQLSLPQTQTSVPIFRVIAFGKGQMVDELTDAREIYNAHPDLVTFLIGCSFSFETALQEAGIEVRHIHDDTNVPMYLSNIKCEPAGRISEIWWFPCDQFHRIKLVKR